MMLAKKNIGVDDDVDDRLTIRIFMPSKYMTDGDKIMDYGLQ